jgi:hypothetical protein
MLRSSALCSEACTLRCNNPTRRPGRPQEMPLPFELLSELLLHIIGIFRRRLSRDHFFLDRLLFERKKPFFRSVAVH